METHPGEGVKEKFPNTRKPSHQWVFGEFWGISEGNITRREKKKQNKTQNTHLMTTPIGEVAQTLMFTTSEQGLDREAQVECLG